MNDVITLNKITATQLEYVHFTIKFHFFIFLTDKSKAAGLAFCIK